MQVKRYIGVVDPCYDEKLIRGSYDSLASNDLENDVLHQNVLTLIIFVIHNYF